MRSHIKFRPDRFSSFNVYWIQTNRHQYTQTDTQIDKVNLYINFYILYICLMFMYLFVQHLCLLSISLGNHLYSLNAHTDIQLEHILYTLCYNKNKNTKPSRGKLLEKIRLPSLTFFFLSRRDQRTFISLIFI